MHHLLIFYTFSSTGCRGAGLLTKMSSKRTTNNSSVASLREQTEVINAITGQVGLSSESLVQVPSEKTVKEKPKKKKAKASASQASPAPGTVNRPVPGNDVRVASRPGTGGSVANAAAGAPGQALGDVQAESPGNALGDGLGEPPEGLEDAWLRQQQQQWWMAQMYQPFGNFVPNFRFGEDLAPPVWAAGEEEEVTPRPVHKISEDEDDILTQPEPTGPASGVQVQGKIDSLVQGQLSQVKECDKVSRPVQEEVANLMEKYLVDATLASEMEKLAKSYPRVENVPHMKVPKLDAEVYQVADQNMKNVGQSLQAIQKGILGCMAAFTPVVELAFRRKNADVDLDGLGDNLFDGLKLLAFANNAVATRRREVLKPHLATTYAKAMTKGQEASPDWLYGGDLVETTKQCEASRRIGEKLLKRKMVQQQQKARGANQRKFRPNFPPMMTQGFPMVRAFNPFQGPQFRFPAPQGFQGGFQQQFPAQNFQYGGQFGFNKRYRNPRPQQKQGFGKRGAYQK